MVEDWGSVTAGIIAPISPLSVRQPAESSRLWRTDMAGTRGLFAGRWTTNSAGAATARHAGSHSPGGFAAAMGRWPPSTKPGGPPSGAKHIARGTRFNLPTRLRTRQTLVSLLTTGAAYL